MTDTSQRWNVRFGLNLVWPMVLYPASKPISCNLSSVIIIRSGIFMKEMDYLKENISCRNMCSICVSLYMYLPYISPPALSISLSLSLYLYIPLSLFLSFSQTTRTHTFTLFVLSLCFKELTSVKSFHFDRPLLLPSNVWVQKTKYDYTFNSSRRPIRWSAALIDT